MFCDTIKPMLTPDPDRERSEKKLSIGDFLIFYNENLPANFPRASISFLKEFKKTFPNLFKDEDSWSLDNHRKKFMDWRPQRIKSLHQ
jgi:hypothetical protein